LDLLGAPEQNNTTMPTKACFGHGHHSEIFTQS